MKLALPVLTSGWARTFRRWQAEFAARDFVVAEEVGVFEEFDPDPEVPAASSLSDIVYRTAKVAKVGKLAHVKLHIDCTLTGTPNNVTIQLPYTNVEAGGANILSGNLFNNGGFRPATIQLAQNSKNAIWRLAPTANFTAGAFAVYGYFFYEVG